jgi:hypothetical protein
VKASLGSCAATAPLPDPAPSPVSPRASPPTLSRFPYSVRGKTHASMTWDASRRESARPDRTAAKEQEGEEEELAVKEGGVDEVDEDNDKECVSRGVLRHRPPPLALLAAGRHRLRSTCIGGWDDGGDDGRIRAAAAAAAVPKSASRTRASVAASIRSGSGKKGRGLLWCGSSLRASPCCETPCVSNMGAL